MIGNPYYIKCAVFFDIPTNLEYHKILKLPWEVKKIESKSNLTRETCRSLRRKIQTISPIISAGTPKHVGCAYAKGT